MVNAAANDIKHQIKSNKFRTILFILWHFDYMWCIRIHPNNHSYCCKRNTTVYTSRTSFFFFFSVVREPKVSMIFLNRWNWKINLKIFYTYTLSIVIHISDFWWIIFLSPILDHRYLVWLKMDDENSFMNQFSINNQMCLHDWKIFQYSVWIYVFQHWKVYPIVQTQL